MDGSQGLHSSGESLGRRVRLNTVVVPQVRALGFVAILVLCGLHHALITAHVSDQALVAFILAIALYNAASWLTLVFFYSRLRRFDLAQLYLYLDVIFFTLAVYVTGGDRSWLLLVLVLRAADQAANGFRTVLAFAHWSTAAYAVLLAYLAYVEHRQLNWTVEAVKMVVLYFGNMYISLTALVLDKMRRQMRNARDLILQLQKKAKDLEQERIKANQLANQKEELASTLSSRLRGPLEQIASQVKGHGQDHHALAAASTAALMALNDLTRRAAHGSPNRLFDPVAMAASKAEVSGIRLSAGGDVPRLVVGNDSASEQLLTYALGYSEEYAQLEIELDRHNEHCIVLRYTLYGVLTMPEDARRIVRDLGGRIRVPKESGRGRQFSWSLGFTLPDGSDSCSSSTMAAAPPIE